MATRFHPLFAFALLSFTTGSALAAEPAPTQPVPAPAAAPAVDPLEAEFRPVIEGLSAKLKAGQRSEAELAPDIAQLDALASKHAIAHPEEASQLVLLKARLQLEVFSNREQGLATLRELKERFPATDLGGKVDAIISALEKQAASEQALSPGREFPTFSAQDMNGRPLDLAAFRGKVVLVDFWATWCGPCVRELPNVIAAYEKYHAKGFEIIGISLDKNRETLVHFLEERKMTWPQYFDGLGWENQLAGKYGINSIPATFLLDAEGKIVAADLRGEELDQKLAELLK